MKNKMNCGCCDDDELSTCLICGNCPQIAEDDKLIVAVQHPDKDLPGFFSNGRVTGEFFLLSEESVFDIMVDYADDSNVYIVRVKIDQFVAATNTQAVISIIAVSGGAGTIIAERLFMSNNLLDFTLTKGVFCVVWEPGNIEVSMSWGGGTEVTLRASKTLEFYSGRVGTAMPESSGSIIAFWRKPGDVTDEGVCPECPDYAAAIPCTCCPTGIDAPWLVDLSAMSLADIDWHSCAELTGVYILDRPINRACTAVYRERFPVDLLDLGCFFEYPADFEITLSVVASGNTCVLEVSLFVRPTELREGFCEFPELFGAYRKVFEPGSGDPCSGTHELVLVLDETTGFFGEWPVCSGPLPATITVTSL